MKIDNELINNLEKLSMISLTSEERTKAKKDIDEIIKYFDMLDELDISPCGRFDGICGPLREDIAQNRYSSEQITSGSSDCESDMFKVPNMIGGNSDD